MSFETPQLSQMIEVKSAKIVKIKKMSEMMPQSPKVNYYREEIEKHQHPLRRIQRSSSSRIILRSATSLPRPKALLTRNEKTLEKWLDKREFGCDICDRKFFHKSAVEAHRWYILWNCLNTKITSYNLDWCTLPHRRNEGHRCCWNVSEAKRRLFRQSQASIVMKTYPWWNASI